MTQLQKPFGPEVIKIAERATLGVKDALPFPDDGSPIYSDGVYGMRDHDTGTVRLWTPGYDEDGIADQFLMDRLPEVRRRQTVTQSAAWVMLRPLRPDEEGPDPFARVKTHKVIQMNGGASKLIEDAEQSIGVELAGLRPSRHVLVRTVRNSLSLQERVHGLPNIRTETTITETPKQVTDQTSLAAYINKLREDAAHGFAPHGVPRRVFRHTRAFYSE